MIFHACFPQFLGFSVVGQLEADGGLVALKLPGANLHEEVVTLVGDLENFRPREPVDPQSAVRDGLSETGEPVIAVLYGRQTLREDAL